jgi:hypothetical protein
MAQIELYDLLRGFAVKAKSPYIDIEDFMGYIGKYAERKSSQDHDWIEWAVNTEAQFHSRFPALVEDGKCMLLREGNEGRIFMPLYCRDLIEEAYRDIDKLASFPLPNAESLKLRIPEGFAREISLNIDMELFFNRSEDSPDFSEVILLHFPQSYGSALMVASMIPRKLMEISFLAVRNFLHTRNNGEYILHKLSGQMQGKEKILKDLLGLLMVRPLECLNDMEKSADFPYLFWTCFCPLVKNDISKKKELLADDIGVLQALSVIEVCCSFYRSAAAKQREIDAALLTLDVQMDHEPWRYTLEEIVDFTNDRGVLLLNIYPQQDLEDYIKKAISEGKDNALPRWLVMRDDKNSVRWFIKKDRYLSVCTKMLHDTQQRIKLMLFKRWSKLMLNYLKEPAMDKDYDFDKLLEQLTKKDNPTLFAMLKDPRLLLVYGEMTREQNALAQSFLLFKDGVLLPFSTIYALNRKELLYDVKLKLPFWFSIPLIVAIIAFFKRLGGRPKAGKKADAEDDETVTAETEAVGQQHADLRQSAHLIQSVIVPPGKTVEKYLSELEGRWARLINKKARQNLIFDVQALVRDNLRAAMKVYKLNQITRDGLTEMAEILISRNPALISLSDQESLRVYIELYMLKLLLSRRG